MQNYDYSFKINIKATILSIFAISLFLLTSSAKGDWVSDANTRIEQIRKRSAQITVVDSNGIPVDNVYVQINQVRHRFAFGTCLTYGQLSSNSNYRNFVLDHFEWAVCENEMKWASNEGQRDNENYSQADYIANWCADNDIKLRGHCLVWETGAQEPSWVSGLACNTYPNPSAKLTEIDERITSAVGRYKGQIVQWDIDNEMLSGNTFGCLGEAGRAHFFELANQIDPNCAMFMNEYSNNSFGGYNGTPYANRAKGLIDLGAPVEGLGIQAHIASPFQPERYYNDVLQKLAVVGVPIMATEYDTETSSEYQRAEDLENFFRICFSHASVEGIIMWGFWENALWRGEGIVKSDWTLNEAGVRYEKLLDEWTTKDSIFTDLSGNASFRGFHGTYEITLAAAGMPSEMYVVEIEPGGRIQKIVLETNLKSTEPIKNINSGNEYIYIQDAINDADPCDTIIVGPGIYNEQIDFLGKNITLSSSEPNNPAIVASTIIKGGDIAVTFANSEDANSIITGFTITEADTGIYCDATFPTISNCRIIENNSSGIEMENHASPYISYCEILCNKGSGLTMSAGRRSRFSMPSINHSVIAANRLHGIYCNLPSIDNCTIAANGQRGISGQQPNINNSIIFYNSRDTDNVQIECLSATIQYSDIQGGWDGTGNINQDPCFAETGFWDVNNTWLAGDYHLKSEVGRWYLNSKSWVQDDATSHCIDAGDPNSDWSEELWPHGKSINMGAYSGTSEASMSLSSIGDVRDINCDNTVTWDDVLRLAGKWNCNNVPLKEDLNLDGIVDANDLLFFEGNWENDSNNTPPVLDSVEDQYISSGSELSFSLSAIDTDSDELVYMVLGLSEGAEFSDQTFTWTPEQMGVYSVTFIVSDYKSLDYITVKIIAYE
ncbi:MAG: endo-1,4-beta-xylanase [Sedimentisphaerales bacterium]|nr:endo-1,4-beta-xylanase [Sedimentisphaerales bacterium]